MSDSWPVKVCLHMPSRTSQSLAEASQAPETNNRESGYKDKLMTSPVWPANVVVCWPVSMSQSALGNKTDRRLSSTAVAMECSCVKLRISWSASLTRWYLQSLLQSGCHQESDNRTSILRDQKRKRERKKKIINGLFDLSFMIIRKNCRLNERSETTQYLWCKCYIDSIYEHFI